MKRTIALIALLISVTVIITGCTTQETTTTNTDSISKEGFEVTSDVDSERTIETNTILNVKDGDTVQLSIDKITKTIAGKEVTMLGYNGETPGPLLHVKQGSQIIVNVTNNLDMDTTVHWHGLRLDNKFDGVPKLTMNTQMPNESFSYTLDFVDEGIYWYHPHVREDLQQELGLYGNILIDSQYEDYYNSVNREVPLVLDDILIENGDIVSFADDKITHALMGRFGNVMLTNGEDNYQLSVNKGDVVRFYITNVANTRTYNFTIPGAQIKLVGSDIGSYEKEFYVDSVVIAPAERYTIEAYFPNSGDFVLQNKNPEKTYNLGTIQVLSEETQNDYSAEFLALRENKYVVADIAQFELYFDKDVDVQINLTIESSMNLMMDSNMMGKNSDDMMKSDEKTESNSMMGGGMMDDNSETMMDDKEPVDMNEMMSEDEHGIEWEDGMRQMNLMSSNNSMTWILKQADTGDENMDIDLGFKIGDKVKIRLYNDPNSPHPMQHPIHFHGQRFLVLEKDGVKSDNLVWKDTVLVPVGSTVDILLDITNPGEWMAHCHIAEHLQSGMMMTFKVSE